VSAVNEIAPVISTGRLSHGVVAGGPFLGGVRVFVRISRFTFAPFASTRVQFGYGTISSGKTEVYPGAPRNYFSFFRRERTR
jgi:hypothetical protein